MFGNEVVDSKLERSKNYNGCTNFNTLKSWCEDEVRKELRAINVIN